MSRKINSPKTEIVALRSICSNNLKVSAYLLSNLSTDHFSNKSTKSIFKYIRSFAREQKEIPSLSVLMESTDLSKEAKQILKDSKGRLKTRVDCKIAVKSLDDYKKLRAVNDIGQHISEMLAQTEGDIDSDLKRIAEMLATAKTHTANKELFTTFGANSDSDSLVKSVLKGKSLGQVIPTGFADFDDENGGMFTSSLFIFGANSGAGKSHLGVSLLINMVTMGYKVVMVPLEMSREEITARMIANVAQVDSRLINTGKLTRKQQIRAYRKFKAWEKACAAKGGWFMVHKPDKDVSIEEVYEVVDAFTPDVCLIDYVTLLKEDSKKDQWKHLGDVARYSKINAEVNERLNILVTQINDDGTVRYSKTINEHANNSWVWLATPETKEQGIIKITQAKARNHADFPFTLGIEYKFSKVFSMDSTSDRLDISGNVNNMKLPNLAEGPDV